MTYAVLCDTTSDLGSQEQQELGIDIIPLYVNIDGQDYVDQKDITAYEFYERLKTVKDRPRSAQPTPLDFMQKYGELFDRGCEQVISVHIAAPLSGTVESARLATSELGKPVTIVDSLGAVAQTALVAVYAAKLRDRGVAFEEAAAKVEEAPRKVTFMLACDTLDALVAGGRLSAEDAKEAGALNIKPILSFNETGVLKPVGKARGMKGVIKTYVKAIADATEQSGIQMVRFSHADNEAAIESVKAMLAEEGIDYIDAGCAPSGATITTHTGMGAIGFACMPASDLL